MIRYDLIFWAVLAGVLLSFGIRAIVLFLYHISQDWENREWKNDDY